MSGCHPPYTNEITTEDKESYLMYQRIEHLIDHCQEGIEILFGRIENLEDRINEHLKKGDCQCNTKKN